MHKIGFDNEKYLLLQEKEIMKRVDEYNQKLYLEIGGKLFDDLHASRVLPGFKSDIKIQFLKKMSDKLEIICCINAKHIANNKMRGDIGIAYDLESVRMIDNLRRMGLCVSSIVITLFTGEPSVVKFAKMLKNRGEKVYFHTYTKGYPNDIETIVSDEGYGSNPFIPTTKPLVVVTAPGPSSGKLATCLSQLYYEYKNGVNAGYAKYETFPIWNLPLNHPINLAYEAATVDLNDENMIDPYHLKEYGKKAVNYNRDVEIYPVLRNILQRITNKEVYKSPTDMGVNMTGFAIMDNNIVKEASKQEIIRRYFRTKEDYRKGQIDYDAILRIEALMKKLKISPNYRKCAKEAKKLSKKRMKDLVALELSGGEMMFGTTEVTISKCSSLILNALKHYAGIDDDIKLISAKILKPILKLQKDFLKENEMVLSLSEVLSALSICAVTDSNAKNAFLSIPKLEGGEAHATFLVGNNEQKILRKLGINLTQEIPTLIKED